MRKGCGHSTANLSKICTYCLNKTAEASAKACAKACVRCTVPTENLNRVCDDCIKFANKAKKCPKCGGKMRIKVGKLGIFWSCLKFPICDGTITARGTYMRSESNLIKAFRRKNVMYTLHLNGTIGPIKHDLFVQMCDTTLVSGVNFIQIVVSPGINRVLLITDSMKLYNILKERYETDPTAAEGRVAQVNGVDTIHWK